MNLLARIKAAFTAERWLRSTMTIVQGSGDAKRQPFSYPVAVRNYASWIYAASTINAIAVASQPLRLYVRNRSAGTKLWHTRRPDRRTKAYLAGDAAQHPSRTVLQKVAEYGDDYEVVTDSHPLLELLSKVNPYQNGFDATVLRVLYGELTGNAYVHPVIDQRLGRPVELWTMPSQYVQVVPGEDVFIEGYLYGASVEQRKLFEPDEVIHFKRPNPNDLYYGMGKVEAAWGAAMQNAAIHEMDLSFFENKARPDYLLTVKGDASPEELERFQAMIESKMQGRGRVGKFLAATADIDVKPLAFPPKDLAGRSDIVEEIAAVFGVPVSMLKANDPNLASATTGYAMWRETTILPLLRMDEETLNQNLVPLFGIEDDAFLAYDNPVKGDERFEFEKRRGLVAGGIITANEARALEGMEPIDDPMADRLLVNGQPLGGPAPAPAFFSADPIQRPDPMSVDGLVGGMDPKPEDEAETGEVAEQPATKSVLRPEMKDALGDCVSDKIPKLIDEGYPQDQAVAIAYSMCSEGKSIEAAIRSLAKAVEDVDTKPPQAVADNARRALEVRETKPESERGMTAVGIARARDLMNRESLSEDTIRRMVAYFERHEVDKQGETWDEQGKGWQAWNGWGGDEGFAWAKRKVEEFDRARGERTKSCGCCAKNGGGDPPAAPSERISGSDRNPEGSASGSRGGIEISEATENALKAKVEEHNAEHGEHEGMKVDLGMLKAVYRRGAGAFSTSHRTGMGREQWAMARVNAFLYLVRNGKPEDADYVTDNDLLPEGHPRKTESKAVSHKALWDARHEILTKASERDAARENREINANEDEIAGAVNRVFDRQVEAVIRKLEASPLPTRELIAEVEQILRARRWNAGIVTALRPYIETALVSGISIGQETLSKVAANPINFEPQNENLRAYARAESVRLADRAAGAVNRYTAVKVTEILGQGVADGETIPQLAERVRAWAGERGDEERGTVARARTIARTEAQRASRSAEVEAWKASGIVEGKTWLLAPDPCEFCEAASNAFSKDGVGIDQAFYAKGQSLEGADGGTLNLDYEDVQGPPLHPNCRCSLQPKLVSDYESIIAEAEKELERTLEENR